MLKSLGDFNSDRYKMHEGLNDNSPRPNGIACPDCGKELMDSTPMLVFTSMPPQLAIHCPECDYHSFRVE